MTQNATGEKYLGRNRQKTFEHKYHSKFAPKTKIFLDPDGMTLQTRQNGRFTWKRAVWKARLRQKSHEGPKM